MSVPIPYVRESAAGRAIFVVGDFYRFLATGAETDGQYAMWEAHVPPGGGPPPHIHSRETESFYVIEGEITFHLGDETIRATAGNFAFIPRGVLHRFHNASDRPVKMIITVAPAGLEEMFFEVGQPAVIGQEPPKSTKEEIDKLLQLAPRYGVEIQLPPH